MSENYLHNASSGSSQEEESQAVDPRSSKLDMNSALNLEDSDIEDNEQLEEDVSNFVNLAKKPKKSTKPQNFDAFGESSDDEEEAEENVEKSSSEFDEEAKTRSGKRRKVGHTNVGTVHEKDLLDEESLSHLNKESALYKSIKPEKLSKEKLEKIEKKLKKTGVVYISKVPPYMKTSKMRQILEKFGKVDRLFLKPETHAQYVKRVKSGGNKKKKFTEGWAEFLNKKDAKLFVDTMNGQKIGGKKNNFYYDDILNLKYLKHFKWIDLTSQMAKENEAKQSKLMLEISRATKLNNAFINNVEKSKMVENIRNKKRQRGELLDDE